MVGGCQLSYKVCHVAHGRYGDNTVGVVIVSRKYQHVVKCEVVRQVFQYRGDSHAVIDAAVKLPNVRKRKIPYALMVVGIFLYREGHPEMIVIDRAQTHVCLVEMEVACFVVVKMIVSHVMYRYRIVVIVASVMGEPVKHDDLVVEIIAAMPKVNVIGTSVLSQEDNTVASAADVGEDD